MTREQAIRELVTTGDLTTGMLKPLGIACEAFLQLAQRDDSDAIVAKLAGQLLLSKPTRRRK